MKRWARPTADRLVLQVDRSSRAETWGARREKRKKKEGKRTGKGGMPYRGLEADAETALVQAEVLAYRDGIFPKQRLRQARGNGRQRVGIRNI